MIAALGTILGIAAVCYLLYIIVEFPGWRTQRQLAFIHCLEFAEYWSAEDAAYQKLNRRERDQATDARLRALALGGQASRRSLQSEILRKVWNYGASR